MQHVTGLLSYFQGDKGRCVHTIVCHVLKANCLVQSWFRKYWKPCKHALSIKEIISISFSPSSSHLYSLHSEACWWGADLQGKISMCVFAIKSQLLKFWINLFSVWMQQPVNNVAWESEHVGSHASVKALTDRELRLGKKTWGPPSVKRQLLRHSHSVAKWRKAN